MQRTAAPGTRAIRRHLRRHRDLMPRAHRVSLAIGAGLVGVYVAVQAYLQWRDPVLGFDLLRLLGLTMVAGREPALFAVYHTDHPVPVGWAALMGSIDDLSTLLLAVPLVWLAADRLGQIPWMDAFLRALQQSVHRHRRVLDRWGLVALAVFLWLPGWGTGPSMAGGMGVLAGIAPARLLPALGVSIVGVNVFWAVSLAGAAQATPRGPGWDWLPLAILLVLVAVAVLQAVLRRQQRFELQYGVPATLSAAQSGLLASRGFERRDGVLHLDARDLQPRGGPSARRLAHCHWAGDLMRLPAVEPAWAGRLAAAGVTGVRDLALLPPDLLRKAFGLEGTAHADLPDSWVREARAEAQASESGPLA